MAAGHYNFSGIFAFEFGVAVFCAKMIRALNIHGPIQFVHFVMNIDEGGHTSLIGTPLSKRVCTL